MGFGQVATVLHGNHSRRWRITPRGDGQTAVVQRGVQQLQHRLRRLARGAQLRQALAAQQGQRGLLRQTGCQRGVLRGSVVRKAERGQRRAAAGFMLRPADIEAHHAEQLRRRARFRRMAMSRRATGQQPQVRLRMRRKAQAPVGIAGGRRAPRVLPREHLIAHCQRRGRRMATCVQCFAQRPDHGRRRHVDRTYRFAVAAGRARIGAFGHAVQVQRFAFQQRAGGRQIALAGIRGHRRVAAQGGAYAVDAALRPHGRHTVIAGGAVVEVMAIACQVREGGLLSHDALLWKWSASCHVPVDYWVSSETVLDVRRTNPEVPARAFGRSVPSGASDGCRA